MELFYDTETSGLWRDNLPPEDPAQPHLLQISAKLCTSQRTESSFTAIIRPEGWSIEAEAEAHHGISAKRAHRVGIRALDAMIMFRTLTDLAERVVAHHEVFDRAVIDATLFRLKAQGGWFLRPEHYCTKEAATPLCRLPGKFGEFKWPSLDEAHAALVSGSGFGWHSIHDAEDDRDACARIFWAVQDRQKALAPA